jgi:hypothetical protein
MDIRNKKPPATIFCDPGTLESQVWEILVSCWAPRPSERPLAIYLISTLSSMIGSAFMQQTQLTGGSTDNDMDTNPHGTNPHLQESVKEGDKPDLVLTVSESLDAGTETGDTGNNVDRGLSRETSPYQPPTGRTQLSRHSHKPT